MKCDYENNAPYQKLQESPESTKDLINREFLEDERIETVLIKVNSSSSAFQIWVMATFYSFHFFWACKPSRFCSCLFRRTFSTATKTAKVRKRLTPSGPGQGLSSLR